MVAGFSFRHHGPATRRHRARAARRPEYPARRALVGRGNATGSRRAARPRRDANAGGVHVGANKKRPEPHRALLEHARGRRGSDARARGRRFDRPRARAPGSGGRKRVRDAFAAQVHDAGRNHRDAPGPGGRGSSAHVPRLVEARGAEPRFFPRVHIRGADAPQTGRGDAAAATWIFRGDESRLRRGYSVETSRGRDVEIRSRPAHASGTTCDCASRTRSSRATPCANQTLWRFQAAVSLRAARDGRVPERLGECRGSPVVGSRAGSTTSSSSRRGSCKS